MDSKITNKQLIKGEVTFEYLKTIFKELEIDSQHKLKLAKQQGKIKIPGYYELDEICQKKTGQNLDTFLNFKRSITKPRQIERIIDPIFIENVKKWCIENNIKSEPEFTSAKIKLKGFPTVRTIIKNYGHDYFTEILGLSRYKHTTEDNLINDDFNEVLKKWCVDNDISSINKYNKLKPKEFPSSERIRQIFGNDYFKEIVNINARNFLYLSQEDARKVCIENHIFTSNVYVKFYQNYNEKNELKLPSTYSYYETNWPDFIRLSETQMFIGNGMSSLELFTYKFLYDRCIDFEIEKTFEDCRSKNPLPFDFYLPNISLNPIIIELDGEHHRNIDEKSRFYSSKIKKHDSIKDSYCFVNNIKLIRINNITDIEFILNKEIDLKNYPKIKDLDWTKDFNTENEIIESQLSKALKVKLLLLMSERGKCNLSNGDIISKTNIKKPHYYTIKNELIKLKLIDRPNEYYFDEKEIDNIPILYKQGKSISEIVRETGYSNRTYLVKRLKNMGIFIPSKPSSKEYAERNQKVIELYQNGSTVSKIAETLQMSNANVSLKIRDFKVKTGELKITEKVFEMAHSIRQQQKDGLTISEIAKKLKCSRQQIYFCLKQINATPVDPTKKDSENHYN